MKRKFCLGMSASATFSHSHLTVRVAAAKNIRFGHDTKDLQCATKHADAESATAIHKLI